ncbi:FBP C-terminal treble-clef zinc-finger [Micromonospora pattaloongensis]|uniref:FBP C-terminal treble-clef zinc-finger n=1 Tax=Micromonospora pattaloongensis TaxID=405436 RepID=A0A1H3QDY1_9ACTN|nr:FBP domain-containing protein [Micromonospora pattaloongensis]SDZ11331.1 FBP C-terminal treble-clef zinc-finger [Micromonospora pattaloongensis]
MESRRAMERVTEQQIRRSMVNCSRGEASGMSLPKELDQLDWASWDFLGWRDAKAPLRGYIVGWRDGQPVGMALRAADSTMGRARSAMCSLCRSVHSADAVSLFTARRAGAAGRNGNTVGIYICADLACSAHMRVKKPGAPIQPDQGIDLAERSRALLARLDAFLDDVLRA